MKELRDLNDWTIQDVQTYYIWAYPRSVMLTGVAAPAEREADVALRHLVQFETVGHQLLVAQQVVLPEREISLLITY